MAQPAFTGTASGKQAIRGVISDFDGSLTAVEAALAGRRAVLTLARRGALAQEFSGELDLSGLQDGVYDLDLVARAGEREWRERQAVVVVNGITAPLPDAQPAELVYRVQGATGPGNEVLFNGEGLAAIPTDTKVTQDVRVPVPAERLRRLNAITFRCALREAGADRLAIRGLRLEYRGSRFRDVRAPSLAEARLRPAGRGQAPELTALIDLTYDEAKAAGQ